MAVLLCIWNVKGANMKRTTIMIPNELKTRATQHAKKIGMSLGGFIRESLEKALEVGNHLWKRMGTTNCAHHIVGSIH